MSHHAAYFARGIIPGIIRLIPGWSAERGLCHRKGAFLLHSYSHGLTLLAIVPLTDLTTPI